MSRPLALLRRRARWSPRSLLPSVPPKQFGGSVTAAFEGWYDNPDGTHSFLIGYFSRNTRAEIDVPIGPNNHFEPGNPDMGQPTHFLTGRRYGMFVFTMPKEFTKTAEDHVGAHGERRHDQRAVLHEPRLQRHARSSRQKRVRAAATTCRRCSGSARRDCRSPVRWPPSRRQSRARPRWACR